MASLVYKTNGYSQVLRSHRATQPHCIHKLITRTLITTSKPDTPVFKIAPEIRDAVNRGLPVVALESQIYTHGHGYPPAFTIQLESIVRKHGAVPATIAVLDGIARIGMSADELLRVSDSVGMERTMKVSRRDLGFVCGLGINGKKLIGGTTISATMLLAQKAGIEILGTGGLGGVHRAGEDSLDISADLTELGRTRVTVISSGCKNFLDLSRTLEFLETQGVCVSTFADGRAGKDIRFPAFYSRESKIKSPSVVEDEKEAAAIILAHRQLEMDSGILFANPISEDHSIPYEELEEAIEIAVREAAKHGYSGSSNTPYILAKIKEQTGSRSIPANRAMIEANVERASKVAVELAKLGKTDPYQ